MRLTGQQRSALSRLGEARSAFELNRAVTCIHGRTRHALSSKGLLDFDINECQYVLTETGRPLATALAREYAHSIALLRLRVQRDRDHAKALAELTPTCHCGSPARGDGSDYADVCTQWPVCEKDGELGRVSTNDGLVT